MEADGQIARQKHNRYFVPRLDEASFPLNDYPEIELLLCCARTPLDLAGTQRIEILLSGEIDWTYLCQLANQHGLMALLTHQLLTVCPEKVPEALQALFYHSFQAHTRHNQLLTEALAQLLALLSAHGVMAVPFKGPILAVVAYGDIALRQFADLDILVRPEDVQQAEELLTTHGYQQGHPPATNAQAGARLQIGHHHKFIGSEGQVVVELHWSLADKVDVFPIDLSQWWRRIEQKRLVDTTVNTFAAEDLLLFLCMHGAKPYHRWSRLIWVTDVAQLIRLQPDLDWEIVLDQAARIGGERRLYFGLLLAANLLGITLPVLVQQRIQADEMVEKLAAQVYAQLFYGVESTAEDLDEFCFYLKTLERRQDQFRAWFYFIVRELIFRWAFRAPPSWLSKLYSRLDRPHARHVWLWPLPLFTLIALFYHLLRPVRQLAKKILRGSA